MKKALKLIILIIVISFGIDKIVYYSMNALSDKVMSGQAIGKLNHYLQKKDSVDLLVFGTSRANHHIDVSELSSSSFNMGMDGTAIAYSSTLIRLLPKSKKQLVIWHIDPNKVFDSIYNPDDILGLNTKYHRDDTIKEEIKKNGQSNPLQSFYYSLDYNGKALGIIKNFIRPSYNHNLYNGYEPLIVNDTQKEIFKNTINLKLETTKNCLKNYNLNPVVKDNLEEVKFFCKKNNKRLIIVTSPTYSPKCKEQYEKLNIIMEQMNITYYDYSSFFVENNSLDYWKDLTHLSKKGAAKFTHALKDTLQNQNILEKLTNN